MLLLFLDRMYLLFGEIVIVVIGLICFIGIIRLGVCVNRGEVENRIRNNSSLFICR